MKTSNYKVQVPEQTCGDWTIKQFTITDEEAKTFNMRQIFSGTYRPVDPGTYTKLTHKSHGLVMSDTPAEVRDHWEIIHRATGHVLINGLGLGMVLQACLEKPEVTHLTVVEISEDLIDSVGFFYKLKYNGRLTIVHADALDYRPEKGKRFNSVWHDIWNEIGTENWPQYNLLHRRYGRRTDWQGSWGRWNIQQMLREERNSYYHPY